MPTEYLSKACRRFTFFVIADGDLRVGFFTSSLSFPSTWFGTAHHKPLRIKLRIHHEDLPVFYLPLLAPFTPSVRRGDYSQNSSLNNSIISFHFTLTVEIVDDFGAHDGIKPATRIAVKFGNLNHIVFTALENETG